jgi:hypothetical protein
MSRVVRYNAAILWQSIDVIDWCLSAPAQACYADGIGPHLRHVLEHYEELLDGLGRRVLEYDSRRRDRSVEQDPQVARARIGKVIERLELLVANPPQADEVAVMLCGGVDGGDSFVTRSSMERELLFLAGHAVHHYAILKPLLIERGYTVGADFGKAPATIHYEREGSH